MVAETDRYFHHNWGGSWMVKAGEEIPVALLEISTEIEKDQYEAEMAERETYSFPAELDDIITLMQSADYKERFKGEYHYVKRNFDRLSVLLEKWDAGTLGFTPDCPRSLYNLQIRAMADYIAVLETRSVIENVDLTSW